MKLGEICNLNMGQSPDSSSYNDKHAGLPFYQGNADFGELFPTPRVWCDHPRKIAHSGELLISVRAPIGAVNYANSDCCIGRGVASLIPIAGKADVNYLFHLLKSKSNELQAKGTGSTFKAISKNALQDLCIVSHDLTAQKQIARTLDVITSLISLRRQQLDKLQQLAKSQFVEMFGDLTLNTNNYPLRGLSEIASYWNGLTYKPSDVTSDGSGTLVLRSSNIQNGELSFMDNVRVCGTIKEKLFVKENDILMCVRNGSAALVGKTALIREITEPMAFGAFMMIIRSEYYSFLKTYFAMPFFRNQISTGTSTINQITGNMLNRIKVAVPDIASVKQYEKHLSHLDKSKFAIESSIEKLEVLYRSKLQEYFG